MLENKFKQKLSKEIEERFPGSVVLHLDPNEIQGIPDLLILFPEKKGWAALEGKKSEHESFRPNQKYYLEKLNAMYYAAAIYPENKEDILNEIQKAFGFNR